VLLACTVIVSCLLTLVAAPAPARAEDGTARFTSLSDFGGTTISTLTGTVYDQIVSRTIPDLTFDFYDDTSSSVQAVISGYADALAIDDPVARLIVANHPELKAFPQTVDEEDYALALAKDSPYTAQVSAIVEKYLADGTMDDLKEKWLSGDESRMKIDWSQYEC
jgi:polar amino acid transport system substrate-binding protein